MKQALSSVWSDGGDAISPDQQAEEYFDNHALPDSSWMGWHPDVSDSASQIKMIQGGINGISDNVHRFGFYPRQELEANASYGYLSSPIDDIHASTNGLKLPWKIKKRGGSVLNEFNFGQGPNVSVSNTVLYDDRTSDTFYFMNYIR